MEPTTIARVEALRDGVPTGNGATVGAEDVPAMIDELSGPGIVVVVDYETIGGAR